MPVPIAARIAKIHETVHDFTLTKRIGIKPAAA